MTRDEMVARMSSLELTHWWALFVVHADERKRAEDVAESGDGIVIEYGKDEDDESDDGDEG
jgi:hypothetical protein